MEEKTRVWGDLLSGLALAALGLYVVIQARQWDYLTPDGPGAGFFPLWYGIAMLVLSLALVASSLRRRLVSAHPTERSRSGRAIATWLLLALAVALCKPLGFLLSFALMTFFIVAVLYRRPMKIAVLVAVACAAGFYVVFPLLLGMDLPVGVMGF
jgi:putative tricarboxylic transport membrane protein